MKNVVLVLNIKFMPHVVYFRLIIMPMASCNLLNIIT